MADRFFDFDAAWAEATASAPQRTLRIYGHDYVLPAEPPARFMLTAAQLAERGPRDRAAQMEDLLVILRPFFGADVVDDWLDRGLGFDQATGILDAAFSLYRREDPDEVDGEGEAEAPETGAGSETS